MGESKPWELTALITRTFAHESEANRATRRTYEQSVGARLGATRASE